MKTLGLIAFLFYGIIGLSNDEPLKYKFIKEQSGIRLYYRYVDLSNGETTRELKTECYLKATKEVVLEHIKNHSKLKSWMQNVKDTKTLDLNTDYWIAYLRYGLPWPLSDQDCVLKFIISKSNNEYSIQYDSQPYFINQHKGVDRIKIMQGYWKITQLQNGICKVEYTVSTERNYNFPQWIADPFVHKNMIDSFSQLRTLVE